MEEGREKERGIERGAREGASQHSDENIAPGVSQDSARETRTAQSRHRTFVSLPLSNSTTTCVGASALSSEAGAPVSTTAVSGLPDTVSRTTSRAEPECRKARQKVRAGAAPSET
ncbi:unnamed protein product [Leuciscus chuanchicus]